ncbi:MAG: electron transfer flavoprotein subunit beta/FixA family protein [Mycobacteriales bacterium]
MDIVVLVKQVPDTWGERALRPDDHTVDRENANLVFNEMDEHAVEEALRLREAAGDGTVTVVCMGPDAATDTIRKTLAMGADAAVHVCDDALHGSCAVTTSAVLAAALGTVSADLVLCGSEASDARVGAMGSMLGERLRRPVLTDARAVSVDGTTVRIERQTDTGYQRVEAAMPAIVSVIEKINEPRYASFKGIMAAKKKPVTTLALADLGIDPATVGLAGSATEVIDAAPAPQREKGQIVTDGGSGGLRVAEFLATAKIV